MSRAQSEAIEVILIISDTPPPDGSVASGREWLPGVLPAMRQIATEKGGRLAVLASVHDYDPSNVSNAVFHVDPVDPRHFADGSYEPIDFQIPDGRSPIPMVITGDMVSKFGTPPEGQPDGIEWRDVLPEVVYDQVRI